MIGIDVGESLFDALSDGVILCSICNTLRPGIVPKVLQYFFPPLILQMQRISPPVQVNPAPKIAFKKMENINNFLKACQRYRANVHIGKATDTWCW
jgi:hypothetical protein